MACRVHDSSRAANLAFMFVCSLALGCSHQRPDVRSYARGSGDLDDRSERAHAVAAIPELEPGAPGELLKIGYFKTRDYIVLIEAARGEHLYTVHSLDRRRLAVHIGERQLAEMFPNLHDLVNDSFAIDARTDRAVGGLR